VAKPALTRRRYAGEDDYWRIREFLRRVFLRNGRREYSWQAARLDYWRWHVIPNCETCPPVEDVTWIWENSQGAIAAVLTPENMGEAHLHIDPDYHAMDLEVEMFQVAEEHLARPLPEGKKKKLSTMVYSGDPQRAELLRSLGYGKSGHLEWDRHRILGDKVPPVEPAGGYTVRSLGDDSEIPARSWASWRAFHPGEPDGNYEGWEWYRNIQRIPMYRRDLDIVGVSPEGEIVAFCTVWYDDVTRTGYFEPVGRMPEHDVRGLMRAVLSLGLHRVQRLGATLATVGGTSFAANVLYASMFGLEADLWEGWTKVW
jgi:hypothetical protein